MVVVVVVIVAAGDDKVVVGGDDGRRGIPWRSSTVTRVRRRKRPSARTRGWGSDNAPIAHW